MRKAREGYALPEMQFEYKRNSKLGSIIKSTKQPVKLGRHGQRPPARRHNQRLEPVEVGNHGALVPLENSPKVAALLINAKVGKWVQLALNPRLRDDIRGRTAHERLQDGVDAVVGVHAVELRQLAAGIFVRKIILPVHVAADCVEAVYYVQDVDLCDVCLVPEAPFWREARCDGWVLAQADHVLGVDDVGSEAADAFPCGVDFRRRRCAEERVIHVDEGPVHLLVDDIDLGLVVDWSCKAGQRFGSIYTPSTFRLHTVPVNHSQQCVIVVIHQRVPEPVCRHRPIRGHEEQDGICGAHEPENSPEKGRSPLDVNKRRLLAVVFIREKRLRFVLLAIT